MGPETRRSGIGEASRYLGVGLTFMLIAGLCTALGVRLDRRWETEPVLTLVGVLVGGVVGFWHLYRQTVVLPREEQAARRAGGRGGPREDDGR